MNNKAHVEYCNGFFFVNGFDLFLYFMLSIFYPVVSLINQLQEIQNKDILSTYSLLVTGLFFSLTFYYDFYSRYRDCEKGTSFVVNFLYHGRSLFFILVIVFLIIFVLVSNEWIKPSYVYDGMLLFPFVGLYPLCSICVDGFKRWQIEKNHKNRKISVGKV